MHGGTLDSVADFYRGADRRQRHDEPQRTIRRVELLAVIAGLLAVGGLVPAILIHVSPRSSALHAQAALRTVWAILFLIAGVLHLVRWRVTGDARTAMRGCGTFCFGLLNAPTAALAPLLYRSSAETALAPITRTLAVLAAFSLLARADRDDVVDTKVRPLRLTAMTVATSWTLLTVVIVLTQTHHSVDPRPSTWAGIECALAVGWLAIGLRAARRGLGGGIASFTWMGLALVLMAVVEVLRALAFVSRPEFLFVGTGIQLVVGTLVLVNAATDLAGVFSAEGNLKLLMSGTLHDTHRQLSAEERAEAARRHDARTVLASLKAASMVLDRYDARLDPATKGQLRSSFADELSRLERMIDGRSVEALETFRLDQAVAASLTDIDGVTVTASLTPMLVHGRADELPTILQSVMSALGRRSPDRTVRVRMSGSTSGTQVICDTPAAHNVEGRSRRTGPQSEPPVHTLRLQVARRLIREQHGDLVLRERMDGSTSVELWLPSAGEIAVDDCVEGGDVIDDQPDVAAADEQGCRVTDLSRKHEHDLGRRRYRKLVADSQVDHWFRPRRHDPESA